MMIHFKKEMLIRTMCLSEKLCRSYRHGGNGRGLSPKNRVAQRGRFPSTGVKEFQFSLCPATLGTERQRKRRTTSRESGLHGNVLFRFSKHNPAALCCRDC